MPLKYEITNIDELPEQLRPLYVERGGKYHLDIEGVDDLGALMRAKGHEAKARAPDRPATTRTARPCYPAHAGSAHRRCQARPPGDR